MADHTLNARKDTSSDPNKIEELNLYDINSSLRQSRIKKYDNRRFMYFTKDKSKINPIKVEINLSMTAKDALQRLQLMRGDATQREAGYD